MAAPERKPLAPAQSREPHTVRFTPAEWERITLEATLREIEPLKFVRRLALIALDDLTRAARVEASVGMPRTARRDAQSIGRI